MELEVEPVESRREWRRFLDLPLHLHRGEPGWLAPLASLDRWLLDADLNPALVDRELHALIGRRRGRVVARIAVVGHRDRVTFSHLEAADDDAVGAMVDAARALAGGWGAVAIEGPFVVGDPADPGLRLDHHDVVPGVGLPWHPARYATALAEAGTEVDEQVRWRVPVTELAAAPVAAGEEPRSGADVSGVPAPYRPWADPRLVVAEGVAVPDVVSELGVTGVLGSWGAARRAAKGSWRRCAVVATNGDARRATVAVATAARAAGYEEMVAWWAGSGPGTRFARFRVPA